MKKAQKKRVVIKVGTAALVQDQCMASLVQQVAAARRKKWDCILVSSGAIGQGAKKLALKKPPATIAEKQGTAAIGQAILMNLYQKLFAQYDISVAQILLTHGDLHDAQRTLNIQHTLDWLLHQNILPIINENDTVATEELRFGDNDQLSALVATKTKADILILLSNVPGLLQGLPGQKQEIVKRVDKITPAIENLAWSGVKSKQGTGGMTSKITAAKIATQHHIAVLMASALRANVVVDALLQKDIGTWFKAAPKKLTKRLD